MRRKGNGCTQHVGKKKQVTNQQLIATEQEFRERYPRQPYRMVQKIKDRENLIQTCVKTKKEKNW
jgi:hypothetical protein